MTGAIDAFHKIMSLNRATIEYGVLRMTLYDQTNGNVVHRTIVCSRSP